MTGTVPRAAGVLEPGQAQDAVAAVAAACSGHVGLAARHLGTGAELTWDPETVIQTASSVNGSQKLRARKCCA